MLSKELLLRPVVAVPARNEAERLPTLLEALARQTWLATSQAPLDVVVVLNNCADHSVEILDRASALHAGLHLDVIDVDFSRPHAHVGSARRLAMQRARDLGGPGSVLFSTDADAAPAVDWIEASLRAIRSGADIVGGHIIGDKAEEERLGPGFNRRASRHLQYAKLVDRLLSRVDPVAHDPWPRHSDHTGASLAVRADVYTAVGGVPALPFREDIGFVAKVVAAGYRLRHPPDVRVSVSARLDGRAQGGMADCLKAWIAAEAAGLPQLVESPETVCFRLARRQRARDARAKAAGHSYSEKAREIWLPRARQNAAIHGPARTIEIETAIEQLAEIIADREDAIRVS